MKIAIIARAIYCRRVLEFLKFNTDCKYEFTGTKYFNRNEVAVFIVEGTEEDIIKIETDIKGMYLSDDVISMRFVNDLPMLQ